MGRANWADGVNFIEVKLPMPRDRQIFCAVMLTPSVMVGNANWSSAICSTVIPVAMQAYVGPYYALGRCLAGLNRRSSKNPGSLVSLS